MHSDRKIPSVRASEAESSDPPTRQRREAAGTSSGDIAGHEGLTASNPGSSGPGGSFAPCGHSACRQNWIDTGEVGCIDQESHTGAACMAKSENAASNGQGRAHSSLALDDDGPRSGMGAVCWAVGAILCVAVLPALYLLVAACMGVL